MRRLQTLIILFVAITPLFGQGKTLTTRTKFMTYQENQAWLKSVKSSSQETQLTEIIERFFSADNWNVNRDSIQYSPLIVINGVPFDLPNSLTDKYIVDVSSLLNEKSVSKIAIADQQPDNWIFGKPFSGAVILTVDRRTDKGLFKLSSQ